MTDILFPPDLVPSTMMFGVDDFTAVDESATTGAMQSSALYGTRRWHLRMDFPSLSRKSGSLARFEALTAALRGRANRVWINPAPSAARRGSFPSSELFVNNDFSAGTISPWTGDSNQTPVLLDRAMRCNRVAVTGATGVQQTVSALSSGVPFAIRGFVSAGKGAIVAVTLADLSFAVYGNSLTTPGGAAMLGGAFTTRASGITGPFGFFNGVSLGALAGDYFDVKWTSLSRCALVDNGVNMMLNSDTPGAGTGWTLGNMTFGATAATAPDGSGNGISLTESSATSTHITFNTVSISSAAADYTLCFYVKANLRTWCFVEFSNGTTGAFQWFNLSTGALGTQAAGTGWTAISAQSVDVGNGWKRCHFTVRKTDASTTILAVLGAANADNSTSYAGSTGSVSIYAWRGSLAQSSVPVAPVQTTSSAATGTLQTGFNLNLKGLPVSTQGLLLEGELVECQMPANSQLLRVIQRLDSDAAGLGTLIFENALKQSPADSAGLIVQQPMGRFVLAASSLGIEYQPGVFGQSSLEFVEAA